MTQKNKMVPIKTFIICLISVILQNCTVQPPSDNSSNNKEINTINWVDDGTGFLQYNSNDKQYYNTWGYSCPSSNILNMNMSEIQIKKNSGAPNIEYGIVFCLIDHNNFYRVSIIKTGYRRIEKRLSGNYSYYYNGSWTSDPGQGWPSSSNLNIGYGVINTIKITRSGSTFSLYFNGNLELTFTDTTFSGGYTGGFAVVSDANQENFPNTSVNVRFKLITAN